MNDGGGIAQAFWVADAINELRTQYAVSTAVGGECRCRKARDMSGMRNYRDLDAWKQAMILVEMAYLLTRSLPVSERFNLISQIQRSATSIPSNIAEGQARGTARFGLYFLRVAIGSSAELATQIEVTRRLKYVTLEATRELDRQLERVQQLLYGMRREHERRLATVGAAVGSLALLVLLPVLLS